MRRRETKLSAQTGLGRVIRNARQEAGLTMQRVAEAAHLHRGSIAAIEAGKDNVTFKCLVDIGRPLGRKGWELFRLAEESLGDASASRGPNPVHRSQRRPGDQECDPVVLGDADAAHDPERDAAALGMALPDLRLHGINVGGPTFGDVADLVRGLEAPELRPIPLASAPSPSSRSVRRSPTYAPILEPSQLAPLVHAPPGMQVLVARSAEEMKLAFFGLDEAYLAVEPRTLVGAVVRPDTFVSRSLYCLRMRSSLAPKERRERLLRRIAVYLLSQRLPDVLQHVAFFRGVVPPPVATIRHAPFPVRLLADSSVGRRLDQLADRVERWARAQNPEGHTRPLHALLAWRRMNPYREEIEQAVRSI